MARQPSDKAGSFLLLREVGAQHKGLVSRGQGLTASWRCGSYEPSFCCSLGPPSALNPGLGVGPGQGQGAKGPGKGLNKSSDQGTLLPS